MDIAINHKLNKTLDGHKRPSGAVRKWLGLFLGFFLVWIFMFIIAPAIEKTDAVKPFAQFIEDSGIDAGALYYTEIEETAEAEMYLLDAARYAPVNKHQ